MVKLFQWLGKIKADKLLHFICGMIIAQLTAGLPLAFHCLHWAWCYLIAAAVAAIAGALKELWDGHGHGKACLKDFIATLIGAAVGLLTLLPCALT